MTQPLDLERMREVALKAATRLTEWLDDFDRNNADDHDNDDFEVGQDELIEVPAKALRAVLDALSSERAAREEAEGERDAALREMSKYARQAGEAIGKLETSELAGIVEGWKDRALAAEAQVSALQAACYVASEPHLSGYRVILGFDTLNAAQDAHEALARARASQPPADEPAKGEG